MKKTLLITLLPSIFLSCQSLTQNSIRPEADSLNGVSESVLRQQIKDSLEKDLTNRIYFNDSASIVNAPVKVITARPVTKEYSTYKDVSLTYKNVSGKNISAVRFKWYGINAFGEPADMGAENGTGGGFDDAGLKAGRTVTNQWGILSRDLKKITKAWAYEVVFKDGTKWTSTSQ